MCDLAMKTSWLFYLFFFFQAEDGIRDVAVTGVQTCALPISPDEGPARGGARPVSEHRLPLRLPGPLHDLFRPPATPGVLGVFAHLDATVDAIKRLQAGTYQGLTVYSPVPRHELEDVLAQPVSPVRMWTLIGGIAGGAFGAWLTLYMLYDLPVVVGGKPVGVVPPYVVLMFEMT